MASKTPKPRKSKTVIPNVIMHLPDDLEPIRRIWTQYYVDFAADLLNKSGLPLQDKHKIIDELCEYWKNYQETHESTPNCTV